MADVQCLLTIPFVFSFPTCREEKITTPFGDPVDSYMIGQLEIGDGKVLEGCELVFLPRHGRGKEGEGREIEKNKVKHTHQQSRPHLATVTTTVTLSNEEI